MNVLPRDGRLTFLEVLAELWIGGGAFAAWHFGSAREQEEWTGKRYIRVGSSKLMQEVPCACRWGGCPVIIWMCDGLSP